MYAYLVFMASQIESFQKSKISTKSSIRKITFEDYKKCLFKGKIFVKAQRTIRFRNHKVFSIKQKKVVLSLYDKRMVDIRSTNTRPWGYLHQACVQNAIGRELEPM